MRWFLLVGVCVLLVCGVGCVFGGGACWLSLLGGFGGCGGCCGLVCGGVGCVGGSVGGAGGGGSGIDLHRCVCFAELSGRAFGEF
ncbi:hypothetical protein, partial [Pseudomonas syringae group genomosp. 7]|uniref:hypothetical protein n=1 Tax=Pseudomonas syringae group genomosp. 7 TaxID=251699 RepID=UPI00376FD4A0